MFKVSWKIFFKAFNINNITGTNIYIYAQNCVQDGVAVEELIYGFIGAWKKWILDIFFLPI